MKRRKVLRREALHNRIGRPSLPIRSPGHFEVLCRVDAYADYVALVEAETAEEAAELAYDDHGSLKWESQGIAEFDARHYVTLDEDGAEIEETLIGDR